jgi:hypothetical protein
LFWVGPTNAGCRCGDGTLDLVLVIDATGSMHFAIGTVKAQMAKIVDVLSGRFEALRVGVVAYRTADGPEFVAKGLPLTDDIEKVKDFLADLRSSGGGGEAVYEGLREAVNNMHYAPDARKVVILVGDEPPAEGTMDKVRLTAADAKTEGVIIHTITMSETAWRYYEFNDPEGFERLKKSGATDAEMMKTFVIPAFKEMSDVTGGSAVPGTDARDIVKWLLALSSGDSSLGKAADDVMGMEVKPAEEERKGLPVLMARLSFDGSCNTPRDSAKLLKNLEQYLPVTRYGIAEGMSVMDERLSGMPLLYLSGHGEIVLPAGGEERLKKYIAGGGRLWADACCGNEKFKESFKALMGRMFPGENLVKLPPTHPMFRVAVPLEHVRYTEKHRMAKYREGEPEAYALFIGGRMAVVFTPDSWGAGWGSYLYGRPCLMHDDDALALSMDLIVYWMEGH